MFVLSKALQENALPIVCALALSRGVNAHPLQFSSVNCAFGKGLIASSQSAILGLCCIPTQLGIKACLDNLTYFQCYGISGTFHQGMACASYDCNCSPSWVTGLIPSSVCPSKNRIDNTKICSSFPAISGRTVHEAWILGFDPQFKRWNNNPHQYCSPYCQSSDYLSWTRASYIAGDVIRIYAPRYPSSMSAEPVTRNTNLLWGEAKHNLNTICNLLAANHQGEVLVLVLRVVAKSRPLPRVRRYLHLQALAHLHLRVQAHLHLRVQASLIPSASPSPSRLLSVYGL